MKRIIVSAAVAALLGGGAMVANASGPGPNGHNNYGLCTAFQNGQGGDHGNKNNAPPFVALQQAADQAGNGDGTATADEIASYCGAQTPGGK